MNKLKFIIPLVLFFGIVAVFAVLLQQNEKDPGKRESLPSPLVGKPAPAFKLTQLHAAEQTIAPEDLKGQVYLLNVWASWCISCRQEHPLLVDLARQKIVGLYGLNYKDTRENATAWLQQFGDPYVLSAFDEDGRVGINYGVYGVPETYLIDKQGVIRYKHIGPISPEAMQQVIIPKIKELNG